MAGSAVLVHGLWSNPQDWRWVTDVLGAQGVATVVPDLPSHRSPPAGIAADADEAASAIAAATPPVVAVGWSYGGEVVAHALERHVSVNRFVSVSSVPQPGPLGEKYKELRADPHVRFGDQGTCVLDDEWWLEEEVSGTFPPDVRDHLWEHRRRPVSTMVLAERAVATAWLEFPVTLLLGCDDPLVSDAERAWACDHVTDVRILDTDHFIPFREPKAIAQVVLDVIG